MPQRVWIDADALLVLQIYAEAVLRHAANDGNREVLQQAIKEAREARSAARAQEGETE